MADAPGPGVSLTDGSKGLGPRRGVGVGVGAIAVAATMHAADRAWALGDIARDPTSGGRPSRIEHWRVAQKQARVAARDMRGLPAAPGTATSVWTAHVGRRID